MIKTYYAFLTIVIITLSLFSLQAKSAELDGKSIQCSFPERWGMGLWVGKNWGVSFENGKAFTIYVGPTYPPKIHKKSFKLMSKYYVDEDQIKWMTSWLGRKFGRRAYFLDRKTLELSSSTLDALKRGVRPEPVKNSVCKIASIKEITGTLSKTLEVMKKISEEKKKKNKL